MEAMLGRLRRTTRTDVGLALAFAGVSYLVWALVAGVARSVVQEMIKSTSLTSPPHAKLPHLTRLVKVFFVDAGFAIDLVGLAWMTLSLVLLVYSSRQKLSISWVWMSAICQSFIAALGAVLVGYASYQPHIVFDDMSVKGKTTWEQVSSLSLQILIPVALLIWVTFLIWLLIERARLNRRGPTLRDGLRSNIYR
jgi:hypothetical protein